MLSPYIFAQIDVFAHFRSAFCTFHHIMAKKHIRLGTLLFVVLGAVLWVIKTRQLSILATTSPVFVPVEKYVVETTETDGGKTFIKVTTTDHANGCQKNVITSTRAKTQIEDSLLVVALIANVKSFGAHRSFKDFIDVIGTLEYDKTKINLAFFCGTDELFAEVDAFMENYYTLQAAEQYGKVTILKAEFLHSTFSSSDHDHKIQRQRRRLIARARNYALLNSLDSEQYTLFMDADVILLDHPDMLKRFLATGKDIIVPRIVRGGNVDYDKNSWRGKRRRPTTKQEQLMDENRWDELKYVPRDKKGEMFHFEDLVKEQKKGTAEGAKVSLDYIVPLDSVGGAILFAKSIIYKQGVVFPPYYIIGTNWERYEGWDGIETEGLCYIARNLGYLCWGMPNLVAQHSDNDWIVLTLGMN